MNEDAKKIKELEEKETKEKKSPTIPGNKKDIEFFGEEHAQAEKSRSETIMPTMIDESEEYSEKKQDLSSIIPQFTEEDGEAKTELISKDNMFKSDASVTIALINDTGEATMTSNASLPSQIDMEKRKKEIEESKNVKKAKKKERRDRKKARRTKRQENIIAFGSLTVIIALSIFGYWFFTHKTEKDFMPKNITVELGSALPTRKSSYIIPGVGKEINDLYYTLDLSNIKIEEIGVYNYTITFQGITKTGTVTITDSMPPELEVRTVIISEGGQYDASTFVESCRDPSGCNYSFQDSETALKYTEAGSYVVYVVATDAFQNKTTKQASLIIETEGNLRKYVKRTPYNSSVGFGITEIYSLQFSDYGTYSILRSGTYSMVYTYLDPETYQADRKKYQGELGYSFSDTELKITYLVSSNTVGSNYTYLDDIERYLEREGYKLE